MTKRRKSPEDVKVPAPRFSDCKSCRFFKPANTNTACRGCEIGENFEEKVKGLDPDLDLQYGGNDNDYS